MSADLFKVGKVWHYRFTSAGERHRGSTKQSDKQLARAVLDQIKSRANRAAVFGPQAEIELREAAALYLGKNRNDEKLVARILASYGRRKVSSISEGETQDWALALYPGCKPSTLNRNVIAPLSAIINHAARRGLAARVRLPLFPVAKPQKSAGTKQWLAAFQSACLARAVPKPHLAAIARFMFETGARIGQTAALTWDELNLPGGSCLLRTKKTGANGPECHERTAWLTPAMVAEIANLPRLHPRFVFGYACRDAPTKMWDKVVKEAGLPRLSRHEAGRHGAFTELVVRQQMNVVDACDILGSRSPQLILKTYAHPEDQRAKAMKAFGGK